MENKKQMNYDEVCCQIYRCIKRASYDEMKDLKSIVVVVINDTPRFVEFIENILHVNPTVKMFFVLQANMRQSVDELLHGKYPLIEWEGNYTEEILDKIYERIPDALFDGFLFFSQQEANTRDKNFMKIAERMWMKDKTRIFCNTIGDELYEYTNPRFTNHAMQTYEDMNTLIEYMLEETEEIQR